MQVKGDKETAFKTEGSIDVPINLHKKYTDFTK